MRHTAILLGLLIVLSAVAGPQAAAEEQPTPSGASSQTQPEHAADHVLVKLAPGVAVVQAVGPNSERVFDRWRRVPVPTGKTPVGMVEELRSRGGIELAELDPVIQLDPGISPVPLGHVDPVAVDDPFNSFQWHFPAIQLDTAWAQSSGEGVVVAVLDSGVSKGGEDLDCHTFVSPYNALTGTPGTAAATDDHGHGTHVAGTVAQCTDNGVGVAGVAFDADLMPVKVLNSSGNGLMSVVAQGIDWARNHGADVINLSLGCNGCFSSMVDDAIESAADAGIVIVAASGNDDANSVFYPASHPDVIAVGATDFRNQRAPYSNRGSALDLVAPGGDNNRDDNGDGEPDGVLQETFTNPGGFDYYWFRGTSMATPHVSGGAALLLAVNPRLAPERIEQILETTALDLGASGFDNSYGHGLIQLHDALSTDLFEPTWPDDAELVVERYDETELALSWSAAIDNVGVTGYRLRLGGATVADTTSRTANVTGLQSGTAYEFEVLARDKAGNWSEALSATVRTSRFFSDTQSHLFYDDILWMSGRDITRGCNPPVNDLFCPEDPVTRGQMAAFIVRALGLTVDTHPGFDDVPVGSTFAGDIGRLATAGITRGCNPPVNDRFCPDDPVTRAQMAALVVRALGLTVDTHPGFDDVPVGSTFAGDIGRLATAGITRGCNPPDNNRFCPDDPITRGQLAAFFNRALGGR